MLIQVKYEDFVYLWCIIGESLLGVLILTLSVLNSLLLFRDKVSQTSCAEKAIKGLGKGLGGQPFSKRVSPNYAVYTPRQTLI